jgi:hypothetical protein
MALLSFRSLWGMPTEAWETDFPILKASGFDGIEASLADVGLPDNPQQFARFCDLRRRCDLKWICGYI